MLTQRKLLQQIVRKQFKELRNNLQVKAILAELFSEGVIEIDQKIKLQEVPVPKHAANKFLDDLYQTVDERKFHSFVQVLIENGNIYPGHLEMAGLLKQSLQEAILQNGQNPMTRLSNGRTLQLTTVNNTDKSSTQQSTSVLETSAPSSASTLGTAPNFPVDTKTVPGIDNTPQTSASLIYSPEDKEPKVTQEPEQSCARDSYEHPGKDLTESDDSEEELEDEVVVNSNVQNTNRPDISDNDNDENLLSDPFSHSEPKPPDKAANLTNSDVASPTIEPKPFSGNSDVDISSQLEFLFRNNGRFSCVRERTAESVNMLSSYWPNCRQQNMCLTRAYLLCLTCQWTRCCDLMPVQCYDKATHIGGSKIVVYKDKGRRQLLNFRFPNNVERMIQKNEDYFSNHSLNECKHRHKDGCKFPHHKIEAAIWNTWKDKYYAEYIHPRAIRKPVKIPNGHKYVAAGVQKFNMDVQLLQAPLCNWNYKNKFSVLISSERCVHEEKLSGCNGQYDLVFYNQGDIDPRHHEWYACIVMEQILADKLRQAATHIDIHFRNYKIRAQILQPKGYIRRNEPCLLVQFNQLGRSGQFTHIFIDRGAQTREPECVAAMRYASPDTKIVIAGNHRQVGPQMNVLGERARKYGFSKSLLECLHSLYNDPNGGLIEASKLYQSLLLTNWRCHSSILQLLSTLFYGSTIKVSFEVAGTQPSVSPLMKEILQKNHFLCEVEVISMSPTLRKPYRLLQGSTVRQGLPFDIAMGVFHKILRHTGRGIGLPRKQPAFVSNMSIADRDILESAMKNSLQLIQAVPGTGGEMIANALVCSFALLNKEQRSVEYAQGRSLQKCVLYCFPNEEMAHQAASALYKLPGVSNSTSDGIRVLYIHRERERCVHYDEDHVIFDERPPNYDSGDDSDSCGYALHSLLHTSTSTPRINEMERKLTNCCQKKMIPTIKDQSTYASLLLKAEGEIIGRRYFDIVICTASEASSERIRLYFQPVQVVVYNASLITEPETFSAIHQASHMVLIGDHHQHRPLLNSDVSAQNGMNVSLFERLIEREYHGNVNSCPLFTHLKEQRDMLPPICDLVSHLFYKDQLQSSKNLTFKQDHQLQSFWPNGFPVVLCNMAPAGGRKESLIVDDNTTDNVEIQKTIQVVGALQSCMTDNATSIVIIMYSTAQKVHMERQLNSSQPQCQKQTGTIPVLTVDECIAQDRRYDVVILSTVTSELNMHSVKAINSGETIRKQGLETLGDPNRLCAAISTSRQGLIILGNADLLSMKTLTNSEVWEGLVLYCQTKRCILGRDEFPLSKPIPSEALQKSTLPSASKSSYSNVAERRPSPPPPVRQPVSSATPRKKGKKGKGKK